MSRERSCECNVCRAPFIQEFKRVCNLKQSGLQIYVHKATSTKNIQANRRTYILYNPSEKQLVRRDFVCELVQYRTKCCQCKSIIKTIHNLIEKINELKDNEIKGVCEMCKHINPTGKCKRCEAIMNKFLCNKIKQYETTRAKFKLWMSNVNELLSFILDTKSICNHAMFKETVSLIEVENLLREIKGRMDERQPPVIRPFPSPRIDEDIYKESHEKITSFLDKVRSSISNDISLSSTSSRDLNIQQSCICTRLKQSKMAESLKAADELRATEEIKRLTNLDGRSREFSKGRLETIKEEDGSEIELSGDKRKEKSDMMRDMSDKKMIDEQMGKKEKDDNEKGDKQKGVKQQSDKQKNEKQKGVKAAKEKYGKKATFVNADEEDSMGISSEDDKSKSHKKKSSKLKSPKEKSEMTLLMQKMKKSKEKTKLHENHKAKKEVGQLASIASLPEIKSRTSTTVEEIDTKSESIIECDQDVSDKEMILGTQIVPLHHTRLACESNNVEPALFHVNAVCSDYSIPEIKVKESTAASDTTTDTQRSKSLDPLVMKGKIQYRLSDPQFVQNGWTVLPTSRILKRMNIYKMDPVDVGSNWFERHKGSTLFYDSGELLATVTDNGNGKWFYKCGAIALEYFTPKDDNALNQRVIVYSDPFECENGKEMPGVLACFDYRGNGVVYDDRGEVRLKYNQSEGQVVDPKIAPPGRWHWHILNEPPEFEYFFLDTLVKDPVVFPPEPVQTKSTQMPSLSEFVQKKHSDEQLMQEIEANSFLKRQRTKLKSNYTSFQIRSKHLKLNRYLSLRIQDQSNIYVSFKVSSVSMKMNLGLRLNSMQIVDWDYNELYSVSTPYEQYPPKTESVAMIQNMLKNQKLRIKIRKRD